MCVSLCILISEKEEMKNKEELACITITDMTSSDGASFLIWEGKTVPTATTTSAVMPGRLAHG
jgi:hypothetical protein